MSVDMNGRATLPRTTPDGIGLWLLLLACLGLVLAAGCARRSNVVIDPAGVDMRAYQRDLAECERIAEQVEQKAGRGAAGGAIVGGAVGGILGGTEGAKKGAGVGAVSGTARGAVSTKAERDRVVKNCLRNRGYPVLN